MHKVNLSDGREITIDMSKVTNREWQTAQSARGSRKQENEVIARVSGFTVDEYLDLSQPDSQRVLQAVIHAASRPLIIPNSQNESTSES